MNSSREPFLGRCLSKLGFVVAILIMAIIVNYSVISGSIADKPTVQYKLVTIAGTATSSGFMDGPSASSKFYKPTSIAYDDSTEVLYIGRWFIF